jgi:hypothetical protein
VPVPAVLWQGHRALHVPRRTGLCNAQLRQNSTPLPLLRQTILYFGNFEKQGTPSRTLTNVGQTIAFRRLSLPQLLKKLPEKQATTFDGLRGWPRTAMKTGLNPIRIQ